MLFDFNINNNDNNSFKINLSFKHHLRTIYMNFIIYYHFKISLDDLFIALQSHFVTQ